MGRSGQTAVSAEVIELRAPDGGFMDRVRPQIASLFCYWRDKCGERTMPRRKDIDPAELAAHLPGILLVDVEGTGPDGCGIFRYRVVGTRQVASRGRDTTGQRVEDGYFGRSAKDVLASYEKVRAQGTAIYRTVDFVTEEGLRIEDASVFLPLSENGNDVSQILVYTESLRDEGLVVFSASETAADRSSPPGNYG